MLAAALETRTPRTKREERRGPGSVASRKQTARPAAGHQGATVEPGRANRTEVAPSAKTPTSVSAARVHQRGRSHAARLTRPRRRGSVDAWRPGQPAARTSSWAHDVAVAEGIGQKGLLGTVSRPDGHQPDCIAECSGAGVRVSWR